MSTVVNHKAVALVHTFGGIFLRNIMDLICIGQNTVISKNIFFVPAFCLPTAGEGKNKTYFGKLIPQRKNCLSCNGVKSSCTAGYKIPYTHRIKLADFCLKTWQNNIYMFCAYHPVPCEATAFVFVCHMSYTFPDINLHYI